MTVYLVDLEQVETRYTSEWYRYLPEQLRNTGLDVVVISGDTVPQTTTPGAFLNFAGTNSYKSQQLLKISELFAADKINDGDYFLYTDAWNPTVIQLKYMASLLGKNIKIGGMWHAGSYDENDFLGRLIGPAKWVTNSEQGMFHCYDHNFFATEFHIDLIAKNLFFENDEWLFQKTHSSVKRVGWPMEYLEDVMSTSVSYLKTNSIVFPHRLAPEKQLDIFKDLAKSMPEYEWIVCQERQLTKKQYHDILHRSKLVFSANLQETLGISCYEGVLAGAGVMVPDRLSYTEMWNDSFKYPSEWTESFESYYLEHKDQLMERIRFLMDNHSKYKETISEQAVKLRSFFHGTEIYRTIKESVL